MSLLFNRLSMLVIAFVPRSKRLLISWLKSPSSVILDPKKMKSVTVSIVSLSICHEVMGPDAMILVSCTSEAGGVEGRALIFSCENSKIAAHCWTIINRRTLDPTKNTYPRPRTKEKPQQDGRRGKSTFRIRIVRNIREQICGRKKKCLYWSKVNLDAGESSYEHSQQTGVNLTQEIKELWVRNNALKMAGT